MQQRAHSVKGGNSVAFHKQECQIHTLCRSGSLRVWKEGKKSLSGVGCGFLGEVGTAWNGALIFAGRHTLSVAGADETGMRLPAIKAHGRTLRKGLSRGSDVYIHQHTTSERKLEHSRWLWVTSKERSLQEPCEHPVQQVCLWDTSFPDWNVLVAHMLVPSLQIFWAWEATILVSDSCSQLLAVITRWFHSLSCRKQPYFQIPWEG